MSSNIWNALKVLYYQLKIVGLLSFKCDSVGNFKDSHIYLAFTSVLSFTLITLSALYYMCNIYVHITQNSLTMYLLKVVVVAGEVKIAVTDVFRYVNRHRISCVWKYMFVIDDVYLRENLILNYNLIKYTGSVIIWIQMILRTIVTYIYKIEVELTVYFRIWYVLSYVLEIRCSFQTIEIITLRIMVACFFDNFFALLQKVNGTTTHSTQEMLLPNLYFNLCQLSREIDHVVAPLILFKLFQSVLVLSTLFYHVISLMVYVSEDHSTIHSFIVRYLILDLCLHLTCVIVPVHMVNKNVSTSKYFVVKIIINI